MPNTNANTNKQLETVDSSLRHVTEHFIGDPPEWFAYR